MRIVIAPYSMTSKSSKELANALGVVRLRKVGSTFVPREDDIIINWGNSRPGDWYNGKGTIINSFLPVSRATNKLTTFDRLLSDVNIPDYATSQEVAQQWVNAGHRVYGRQTLTGHGGQGIVIFHQGDIVTPCPLYTKDTKATHEYRIHVAQDHMFSFQQKKKREGQLDVNEAIRNHGNGWVFCREGVVVPSQVQEQAVKAVQALGLDFGAVDVGYNQTEDKAYVYEVNTAPGLTGKTIEHYKTALLSLLEEN